MKVVQINCTYNQGSTGKIVADIHHHLRKCGVDSKVIFGVGDPEREPDVVRAAPELIRKMQSLRSRITGFPYGGCLIGTDRILRFLQKEKPDVVHLHCINAYMVNIYRLLAYLKRNHIATVLTLHAEFMYTSGCSHAVDCPKWRTGCHHCDKIGKEHPKSWFFDRSAQEWRRMQEAYEGFEDLTVCAVSDWVRERACQSPFFSGNPVVTVLNGVNTSVFHRRQAQALRQKLGLKEEKVILHVTPDFYGSLKGGPHVIEMARRFPDVRFLVVGCGGAGEEVPGNMTFLAHTEDQSELAEFYSMADLCLLTSVRETFSMVCAESLCCGTPVVGFQAGAPETITIPQYSRFVAQGDDDALEAAIRMELSRDLDRAALAAAAQEKYSQEKMVGCYDSLYHEILKSKAGAHT